MHVCFLDLVTVLHESLLVNKLEHFTFIDVSVVNEDMKVMKLFFQLITVK